jgi:hypothetical protein
MPNPPSLQEKMDSQNNGSTRTRPQCRSCRWFDAALDRCPAFPAPRSIPLVISLNRFNHAESIWPGQEGAWRWEPEA